MEIRLATRDDVPAILEISNWAALNTPANFAIEPERLADWQASFDQTSRMHPWLVAIDGNDMVGFAKSSPHKGRCAYAWTAEVSVYIHPQHHNRGVGKMLYARLIPLLKSQGYITLIAGITIPNPASQRLHESFGFRCIGTFERVGWKFNCWHDVSYWEVVLDHSEEPPWPIRPVLDVMASAASTVAAG